MKTGIASDSVSVSATHSDFGSQIEIARRFVSVSGFGWGFETVKGFAFDSRIAYG